MHSAIWQPVRRQAIREYISYPGFPTALEMPGKLKGKVPIRWLPINRLVSSDVLSIWVSAIYNNYMLTISVCHLQR